MLESNYVDIDFKEEVVFHVNVVASDVDHVITEITPMRLLEDSFEVIDEASVRDLVEKSIAFADKANAEESARLERVPDARLAVHQRAPLEVVT